MIENYAQLSRPLTYLIKKEVKFQWTQDQQQAFEDMKLSLMTAALLAYPYFLKALYVTTDASKMAVAGILSQYQDCTERPIAFASRQA